MARGSSVCPYGVCSWTDSFAGLGALPCWSTCLDLVGANTKLLRANPFGPLVDPFYLAAKLSHTALSGLQCQTLLSFPEPPYHLCSDHFTSDGHFQDSQLKNKVGLASNGPNLRVLTSHPLVGDTNGP